MYVFYCDENLSSEKSANVLSYCVREAIYMTFQI